MRSALARSVAWVLAGATALMLSVAAGTVFGLILVWIETGLHP